MKIRIMGTEDECREVAARLTAIIDVLEVSEPRANRGASVQVRVYVEGRLPASVHVTSTAEARRALPPGGIR